METNYNGVVEQTPEEKAKNFTFAEAVGLANANPVNWVEKKQPKGVQYFLNDKTWRRFDVRNQDGSGSCFPWDTKILMEDFSEKKISEIMLGDMVVTHKGNIRKVTHLFKRKWQGNTIALKVRGIAKEIEATEEHPIYAIKRVSDTKPYNEPAGFHKISDLNKRDWVGIPIVSEIKNVALRSYEKDPDFLWAYGLYLAEGSIEKYRVRFSLHKNETDYLEKLKSTFKKYGSDVSVTYKTRSNGMQVSLEGKYWAEIFEKLGGKYSDKKKIDDRFMFLQPVLQMKIVEGMYDGDGHYGESANVLVSTSSELIRQAKLILLRNGIYSFEHARKSRHDRKQVWSLQYAKNSRYSFFRDGYVFVQIDKKKTLKSFSGGHVYNFEVDGDNSYIANGIAVHNCVIQTLAKLAGILAYIKWGKFIEFSAGLYGYRANNPQSGTGAVDAYKMGKTIGFTLEEFLPSHGLDDAQMNAIRYDELHKAMNLKFDSYIFLPEKDIDAVASVIQTTKKGLMTWFRFGKGEWTDVPKVLTSEIPNHHSIASVDLTLYNKEKALIADESWGDTFGMKGQRVITESFFKERNTHVSYPITFKFEPESVQNLPSVVFAKQLVFIQLDAKQEVEQAYKAIHEAQIEDVKRYQDILKAEGCMPTNVPSTGLFHNITAKATMSLQIKHSIAPIEEIKQLEGKVVGPKTLAYLNSRK